MEKGIELKRIGIIGSRRRNSDLDYNQLLEKFKLLYEDGDEIVSGGCPSGGDKFAEIIAKELQIPIKIYYARWNKLGKRAGFIRNSDIARDSDILIALVASDRTGGTEDTIQKFIKTFNRPLDCLNILDQEGVEEDIDPLEMPV